MTLGTLLLIIIIWLVVAAFFAGEWYEPFWKNFIITNLIMILVVAAFIITGVAFFYLKDLSIWKIKVL